jgi:hypothetical protein
MRYRSLLLVCGITTTGILILAWLAAAPFRADEQFDQIEIGVTKHDVLRLLGSPNSTSFGRWPPGQNWVDVSTWQGWRSEYRVYFRCPVPDLVGNKEPMAADEWNKQCVVFRKERQ